MTPQPILTHGETFGDLTVLRAAKSRTGRSARYWVGCACGNQGDRYSANALMRAGGVRKCSKCRAKPDATKDEGN